MLVTKTLLMTLLEMGALRVIINCKRVLMYQFKGSATCYVGGRYVSSDPDVCSRELGK